MIYQKIEKIPKFIIVTSIENLTFNYIYIIFFSKFGFMKYKFLKNSSILVKYFNNSISLLGINNQSIKTYCSLIKMILFGLKYRYFFLLKVVGLGYKYKIFDGKIFLILGYTHLLKVSIPKNLFIKLIKKKKVIKLISHDKLILKYFIFFLKSLRPIDIYKAKGIRLKGEIIITKVGKKSKF